MPCKTNNFAVIKHQVDVMGGNTRCIYCIGIGCIRMVVKMSTNSNLICLKTVIELYIRKTLIGQVLEVEMIVNR